MKIAKVHVYGPLCKEIKDYSELVQIEIGTSAGGNGAGGNDIRISAKGQNVISQVCIHCTDLPTGGSVQVFMD